MKHSEEDSVSTIKHGSMTGILSERLALCCGFSDKTARQIRLAANLHDIGKCKIPKSILEKPDKLTAGEFNIVKLHTVYGYILLESMRGAHADMARCVAMYHHERYDGHGYWSMARDKQPLYLNIVTLADVFTALISKRVYKPALPLEDTIQYIENNAGSQFNPYLVRLFVPLAIAAGKEQKAEQGNREKETQVPDK